MLIENDISFGNTLSIKRLAHSAETQALINNTNTGNESQEYTIGQCVNCINYRFNGTIVDTYNQNGYWYYTVEYKLNSKARKTFTKSMRQSDIKPIEENAK